MTALLEVDGISVSFDGFRAINNCTMTVLLLTEDVVRTHWPT